jgi:hypothetical protein
MASSFSFTATEPAKKFPVRQKGASQSSIQMLRTSVKRVEALHYYNFGKWMVFLFCIVCSDNS